MDQKFYDLIESNPVIAAVKDIDGLNACCAREEIKVVFILFGDICNIGTIVSQIKQADKVAMVHVDLITGLSGKEVAVDFIKNNTLADGIISTKPALIKRARELSLYTRHSGYSCWIPWHLRTLNIRWPWPDLTS